MTAFQMDPCISIASLFAHTTIHLKLPMLISIVKINVLKKGIHILIANMLVHIRTDSIQKIANELLDSILSDSDDS